MAWQHAQSKRKSEERKGQCAAAEKVSLWGRGNVNRRLNKLDLTNAPSPSWPKT
jgi:hypothetical protein